MTVSRPSLRIRRGRWRTRALAASPTAAEHTARCSTGVRRAPKNSSAMARSLLFALLRFLCRPGRWSTRLKLQRPPEGSAQVDGNVAKIDLAARGVDGALVHFNAPSWAVRAVMSSTTLPVCPKTGSTSPSLTVHLCLHTVPGNRECAPRLVPGMLWLLAASVAWDSRRPRPDGAARRAAGHDTGGSTFRRPRRRGVPRHGANEPDRRPRRPQPRRYDGPRADQTSTLHDSVIYGYKLGQECTADEMENLENSGRRRPRPA